MRFAARLSTLLVLFHHLLTLLIDQAIAQAECIPLMQSLLQQTESSDGYGSWDACCAKLNVDCFLTRQAVPPGSQPCDAAHSARASCSKTPQATICMINGNSLITNSPCGRSQIKSCTSVLVLDGVSTPSPNALTHLNITPVTVLSNGVLGTQLCCSSSSCQLGLAANCTSPYTMSCVSDGGNVICLPFDGVGDLTYLAVVAEDCAAVSTSTTINGASDVPETGSSGKKQANIGIIIGAVAAVVVLIICIGALALLWLKRRRNLASNTEYSDGLGHERLVTSQSESVHPLSYPSTPRNPLHPPLSPSSTRTVHTFADPTPVPEPTSPTTVVSSRQSSRSRRTRSQATDDTTMVARVVALEARMASISASIPRRADSQITDFESVSGPDLPPPPAYDKLE